MFNTHFRLEINYNTNKHINTGGNFFITKRFRIFPYRKKNNRTDVMIHIRKEKKTLLIMEIITNNNIFRNKLIITLNRIYFRWCFNLYISTRKIRSINQYNARPLDKILIGHWDTFTEQLWSGFSFTGFLLGWFNN